MTAPTARPSGPARRGIPALLLLVALTMASLSAVLGAAPAGAAPGPPKPLGLSIAVDDGHTTTTQGDRLAYTVTVQNIGRVAAHHLAVSQTMPAGLRFVSADRSGKTSGRSPATVSWVVDIKPGKTAVLHSTGAVGSTPAQLLRLATVACASTKPGGVPIVCATHSDQLPAGAAAAAAAVLPSARAATPWSRYAIGAGVVLMIALVVLLVRRVRRKRLSRSRRPAVTRTPIGTPEVDPLAGPERASHEVPQSNGRR